MVEFHRAEDPVAAVAVAVAGAGAGAADAVVTARGTSARQKG